MSIFLDHNNTLSSTPI